jgi:error-prone DNA polymerase
VTTVRYAELQVTTNYSFLRGGSHPGELVYRAASLGHYAIGISDRNTLAGVVRAFSAIKDYYEDEKEKGRPVPEEKWIKLLVGARLETIDGYSLLAYPMNVAGYRRLSRLLTVGNRRADKGKCDLTYDDLAQYADDLIAIVLPPRNIDDPAFLERLCRLARLYGDRCYLAGSMLFRGDDARRLACLDNLAAKMKVRFVATNDVHYHIADRRALQDVITAIRLGCTVEELGFRRFASAERHLKAPEEMHRLFRKHPHALENIQHIVERCTFSLTDLTYQYPVEYNGETPMAKLKRLTWEGAAKRYPGPKGVPSDVADTIRREFDLIALKGIAPYFLTVHEIVEQARSMGIFCQGRGSAANSAVCYCLGITPIDPDKNEVLFERFLSNERNEPPDIDVDFEHERREELIQWIYGKWSRDRAALAATVIAYRSRSAIRDVGKALGLSPDTLGVMADTVWGSGGNGVDRRYVRDAGLDTKDPRLVLALELSATLCGFPRHLSQHVGGFVLTADRLDELIPIQNAAMEDRTVVEWDKDDLDALGIYKIDVLALGMLTALRMAFDLIERHYGKRLRMDMPTNDKDVYEMLGKADSVGVFQVESRAQMSMLPRLKPKDYYDLVVEVAIVRPGPIQGGMVHPYLKNRANPEAVTYPKPELENVLKRTLGVPLFQEQAMQMAIVAAGFSPTKADTLRRAMATFRRSGTIHKLKDDFINGMVDNDYEREFADRCFKQIEGFGEYGFPESHAASFAILVYVSSWVKFHYPEVFCAALLNAQPMGFYAPAQLVRDAREHGVEVRPPDVNASDWDCTLEPSTHPFPAEGGPGREQCALRLGFRQVTGLAEKDMKLMVERRGGRPYRDPADLWRRSGLTKRQILALARADAFASLGLTRRDVLWAVRAFSDASLPLFEQRPRPRDIEPKVALPKLTLGEQVVDDYSSFAMSLRAHPVSLLRPMLSERRVARTSALLDARNGDRFTLAGLVLVRQRPGTASGVVFVTIEDEDGIANLVVWPKVFEAHRRIVMGSRLLAVTGEVQRDREDGLVIHLVADRLWDWSAELDRIAELDEDFQLEHGRGDQVRTDRPDPRVEVPEANATRHRASKRPPTKKRQPYDRSRIHLDRPIIRIASRDFH